MLLQMLAALEKHGAAGVNLPQPLQVFTCRHMQGCASQNQRQVVLLQVELGTLKHWLAYLKDDQVVDGFQADDALPVTIGVLAEERKRGQCTHLLTWLSAAVSSLTPPDVVP
jgi:hypothetical protein